MKRHKIIAFASTKKAILEQPSLGCTNKPALSEILAFKRNNRRAFEVRNYAMNHGTSVIVDYEENANDPGQTV